MTHRVEGLDQIHHGDALALLNSLPDECAGLVIADPPYNLGPKFGSSGQHWDRSPDWLPWCEQWLSECLRVLDTRGNLFVYGIHHYLCYLQVYLYEIGAKYRRQIIWHYENGFTAYKNTLATHYEPILWFSKSDDYRFSTLREPYKSTERLKHRVTKKNGEAWIPHPEGRIASDVWDFPVLAGRRFKSERVDHPTQKPLALTNRIVEHFSEPGDLIIVPFAGSGTECVSATLHGRHFWASEINADYIAIAESRIASHATDSPKSTRKP